MKEIPFVQLLQYTFDSFVYIYLHLFGSYPHIYAYLEMALKLYLGGQLAFLT